jgi:ABC-type transport system involved in multi-copper enzyme maturation permease subunit
MGNLIKTDLIRVLKDKLFLVLCILCGVFALISPLLYKAIDLVLKTDAIGVEIGNLITAKQLFFESFSLGNNFGLIAPVLLAIVLYKDFNHGTIRNKIICGYSRASIFWAMYGVCAVVLLGIILVHALLTLGVSMLMFEFQATPFTSEDAWYFVESLLFEVLCYLFMSALVVWLWATMKNMGVVIVMYVAVVFGASLVAPIVMVAVEALQYTGQQETLRKGLEIFQNCNLFYSSMFIGTGVEYTTREALCYLLSPIVCGAGLLGIGLNSFRKRDLK